MQGGRREESFIAAVLKFYSFIKGHQLCVEALAGLLLSLLVFHSTWRSSGGVWALWGCYCFGLFFFFFEPENTISHLLTEPALL